MAKKSNICSSVEGEKLSFNTRKFNSYPPTFNEILKINVWPFKLGINGYVEIDTPLEDPPNTVTNLNSLTATGDSVQGGTIDGWSTKPIKNTHVGNLTGTHKATLGTLKGHSYAHVQSGQRDHQQSADVQSRHPDVIEIINPVYLQDEVKKQT